MAESPLDRRIGKRNSGTHGQVAEKRTAKRLAADLTPASGAIDGAKGDMATCDMLIENKATKNASMSLKLDWLQKIAHEAEGKGKQPALAVQFVTTDGKPVRDGAWVMVPEWVFKERCM